MVNHCTLKMIHFLILGIVLIASEISSVYGQNQTDVFCSFNTRQRDVWLECYLNSGLATAVYEYPKAITSCILKRKDVAGLRALLDDFCTKLSENWRFINHNGRICKQSTPVMNIERAITIEDHQKMMVAIKQCNKNAWKQ